MTNQNIQTLPGACKSDVEAVHWFGLAMEQGDGRGTAFYGYMVEFEALLFRSKAAVVKVGNRFFFDFFDLHSALADGRSLIVGRQECGAPVLGASVLQGRFDAYETGKIPIL